MTNVNATRQEIFKYFANAVSTVINNGQNLDQIKQTLQYCELKMEAAGTPYADVYRVRAFVDAVDHLVSDALIEKMWGARDNWGQTLLEVGRAELGFGRDEMAANGWAFWPFGLVYDYPWGIRMKITTTSDVLAATAWQRVRASDFESAHRLLATGEDTPVVRFVRALLYYHSRRWSQAREVAESLMAPPMLDPSDAPVRTASGEIAINAELDMAAKLIAATALAHLDNTDAASIQLKALVETRSEFGGILAEACRIQGLIFRRKGDEEKAQAVMNVGMGLANSKELAAAAKNSTVGLTVTSEALIDERRSYWDPSTEKSLESALAADAEDSRRLKLIEAEAELNRQIGMAGVKEQVLSLQHKVRFEQELERRGKSRKERSNHIIFSGPPGTGKTTIARLLADILFGYGVISKGGVTEVSRADLVAEYEGQTARRTKDVIAAARGGVLFIDEAYSLVQERSGGSPDSFGQEAIDVLLKEMEDGRSDLIVIIAGYEDKLNTFLAANEGLRSRFKKWIRFESYSIPELAQIGKVLADARGSILLDDGVQALDQGLRDNLSDHVVGGQSMIDRAGNGRFIRNVVEIAEEFRESRLAQTALAELSDDDLMTLSPTDIREAVVSVCRQVQ